MLFSELVDSFNVLNKSTKRLEITAQLAEIFLRASPAEARIIAYLVRGELRPQYEGQTVFGLAERTLRGVAVQLVAELSPDKFSEYAQIFKTMDIADIVQYIEWDNERNVRESSLTVQQVYDQLISLSMILGTGAQEVRIVHLVTLLMRMRPIDAALVLRIILGKLRLGFSDMTIIDALSWYESGNKSSRARLEEVYNIHADLGDIAYQVRSGGVRALASVGIMLGVPIRPAAAERLSSAAEVIQKIGPCVVQPKLDGFRLQVHVIVSSASVVVHFFSRNLQRMDDMFPELRAAFMTCSQSMILDGEAIAYDEENDQYLSFQDTVKRRRKWNIDKAAVAYPLKFIAFDILYMDSDAELLYRPHSERYVQLQQCIKKLSSAAQSVILLIEERKINEVRALEEYFTACVEQGFEGVVVKRDTAEYQAGKRNFNWIKLKRQEIGALQDTIDTVVLGYYYGKGKRARFGIGACLVGVYDSQTERFVTIAKLGTGLSDDDWKELKKRCDEYAVREPLATVVCADALRPDVWVAPAIVVEVAADEITRSPVHTAARDPQTKYGLALRFPRMISFRSDKGPFDATTVAEVIALFAK